MSNWECSQIVLNIPGGIFLACSRVPAKFAIDHEPFAYKKRKKKYFKRLMKSMCKGGPFDKLYPINLMKIL